MSRRYKGRSWNMYFTVAGWSLAHRRTVEPPPGTLCLTAPVNGSYPAEDAFSHTIPLKANISSPTGELVWFFHSSLPSLMDVAVMLRDFLSFFSCEGLERTTPYFSKWMPDRFSLRQISLPSDRLKQTTPLLTLPLIPHRSLFESPSITTIP